MDEWKIEIKDEFDVVTSSMIIRFCQNDESNGDDNHFHHHIDGGVY